MKRIKRILLSLLLSFFLFILFVGILTIIDYHRFKNADTVIKPIITTADCECKCGMDRQIDGLFYSFEYMRCSDREEWEESVIRGSFLFPLDGDALITKKYQ